MPLAAKASPAASLLFCDRESAMTAGQQDRLFRFAAIVRRELDNAGHEMALISRNGTDLHRFGIRYSHAGFSLKASRNGPWSVRQLYYACDERRPRLYDQGLPGFLFGTDDPETGYVSIVLLPDAEGAAVERAALDNALGLRLLGGRYSANAYPFSVRYQNCNQWVMELLAAAWAPLAVEGNDSDSNGVAPNPAARPPFDARSVRNRAQQWLATQGYVPAAVELNSHLLMFAAPFVPMIHLDDHPLDDRFELRLRLSLPASIEAFLHQRLPGAVRIELCHDAERVVIHRGWESLPDGCTPLAGDAVIGFK